LYVDGAQTNTDAQNNLWWLKNSIIAGSGSVITSSVSPAPFDLNVWFTTTNSNRSFATTDEALLNNPYNLTSPDPLPRVGSPVLTGGATPPNDGFFDSKATFIGAFGSENWAAGWTKFNFGQEVVVSGNITTNTTWTSDKTYLMDGFIRVQDGATLTIEPGTVIYGKIGSKATLIIKQGGKLIADGTASKPIVFTSENTKPGSTTPPASGDWGGIIILGKAKINPTAGTAQIEGTGEATDIYGGTNDDDNSGILRYVRVEFPGIAYAKDNEINGVTFGGVGRGTIVDYVQVAYSGDDSFEWFGGTVNAKHLIAFAGVDDDFDTDYGYTGKLQFLLGVRHPNIADQAGQSNGFESDNDAAGSTNTPRTSPTYYNVTLVGPKATSATTVDAKFEHGMRLRRSSLNKVHNALIMGWPKSGLYVDGAQTNTDAQNNLWWLKNSIIAGSGSVITSSVSPAPFDLNVWFTTTNSNKSFTNSTEVMLNNPFDLINPNYFPKAGSPALTGAATPPNDGFFDASATYIGAFKDVDWTASWSTIRMQPITSIKEKFENIIPSNFELSQNYPNPFNPSTRIQFSIPKAGMVRLNVYNVLGEQVASLVNGFKNAGRYSIEWNAGNLSSGMYIYRLETENSTLANKMLLMK